MALSSSWRVLDYGEVPMTARTVDYVCLGCGHEAVLPVLGLAIAQIGQGLVFDSGGYAMPKVIQCRRCRRQYELEPRRGENVR